MGLLQLGKSVNVCNVCMKGSTPSRLLETIPPGVLTLCVLQEASSQETLVGMVFVTLPTPSQFLTNSFRWLGSRIWVGSGNVLSILSFSFNSSSC